MRRLFVLIALLGCGTSEPAPEPTPEPVTPPALDCSVLGVVTVAMEPAAVAIEMRASEPVGEREYRGVAEDTGSSTADGAFSFAAPCATRISLAFPGWIWANEPQEVTAEPEPSPLDVVLVPQRTAHLKIVDAAGAPLTGLLTRTTGEVLPIPVDGVHIKGLPYGHVAGTITGSMRR